MASPAAGPAPENTRLQLLRAAAFQIAIAAEALAAGDLDLLRLAVEARSSLATAAVKVQLAIQREATPVSLPRRPAGGAKPSDGQGG